MLLIIISGPAAAGKTSLGLALSRKYQLPFFHKDRFKELMFDITTGAGRSLDLQEAQSLGRMSFGCLEIVLEELASVGISLIVEANFDRQLFSPRLMELKDRYGFRVVEVNLRCEGQALLQRFIAREQEDRHPGHQGMRFISSIESQLLQGQLPPLDIDGKTVVIDTTNLDEIDYSPVFKTIEANLGRDV
jgi:predicted kinase